MSVVQLPTAQIFRRVDARKIDNTALRGLMASISEIGIINPLRVRAAERMVNGVPGDAWEVTAGAHRLQAAIKLGMETVPCVIVEDDDLHAELAMIDENLCRADLTPAERSAQTARRKAIYVELHPETAHGGDRRSDQVANSATRTESFTAATSSATGKSERTVRLDAERGEKIAPDVLDKIRGTHLDKGDYLDTLKRLPVEEQRTRVDRALSRPKEKPAKLAPSPKNDFETKEDWMAAMMRTWNRGSKEWREEFLSRIDQPVMDAA